MKMRLFLVVALISSTTLSFAGDPDPADSLSQQMEQINAYLRFRDSVENALKYETGLISLPNGVAQLNVPAGFKYLDAAQSEFVLTKAWGNPPRTGTLGMIFPEHATPFSDSSYAFVITFDEMGYVKDNDADKIDYDEMLSDMWKSEPAENKERESMGYESIHMVGWAQKPFYDKSHKVLHWAKELQFGDEEIQTLNYDVRILGRKGVLSLNAVATMDELDLVKNDIDKVLAMASFTEGNRYGDFDSKVDKVAAWTIGGLVAGKVLAKAGAFVFLAKFAKIIFIGLAAAGGAVWRFITGRRRRKDEELATVMDSSGTDQPAA